MVSIKSAKKGALAVSFDAKNESEVPEKISEALNYSASRNYSLCYVTVPSTKKYRVEKTELGMFVGGDEAYNAFSMNLPKIPKEIMEEIYSFFLAVKNYMPRSNEAAAQIFWDKRKKEYLVYYPKQYVSTVEVDFHRDMFLENDENFVLVMDVHSHGIIRPMFSGTDDMDEKGTRLFCVFGNMEDTTMYHFSLRAGTGGHFIKVNEEEIFDNFFDGMFTNGNVVNPDARRTQKIAEIIAEKVSFR